MRRDGLRQYWASFATSVREWAGLTIGDVREMLAAQDEKLAFGAFCVSAEEDMALVGIVGFLRQAKEKYRRHLSVWGMYVQAEWQGRGTARMLLEGLIAHAGTQPDLDQILLVVKEGNQGARPLYEKLDFRAYRI